MAFLATQTQFSSKILTAKLSEHFQNDVYNIFKSQRYLDTGR